ncbi:phage tail tape measure protein [Bacillus sp. Wb]
MSNDLKIILSGSLDFSKTQKAIDNQILALEKKISKVKINIDLNDNTIRTMQQFSRAVEDYKRTYDGLNSSMRENNKITKNNNNAMDSFTDKMNTNRDSIQKNTKAIEERKKAFQAESKAIQDNLRSMQKQEELQKRQTKTNASGRRVTTETTGDKYTSKTVKTDNLGKVIDSTFTENFAKKDRDIERITNKLNELKNAGVITGKSFNDLSHSLNLSTTEKEIKSVEQSLKKLQQTSKAKASTDNLSNKITNFQGNAELDAEKLKRSRRSTVDTAGLDAYINKVKKLSATTPNVEQEIQKLRTEFKKLSLEANKSATVMGQFGRDSLDAFKKFGQWMLVGGAFAGITAGFQDMMSQIIEIDTAMTDLRRVMDAPEAGYSNYLKEAISLSNELGNSLKDVLSIGTDFARMGFDSSQLVDMTKTAQVLQNISDLDASQSVDTLTAAMLNFGIEAKDSLEIADQLNEVDKICPLYQRWYIESRICWKPVLQLLLVSYQRNLLTI